MLKNDNGEAAAEFYDQRRLWAEYACKHAQVTDRAFRVGYWLSRRMNGNDRCCWYSIKRIAKEMGRSPRTVSRALLELKSSCTKSVVTL